MESLPSPLRENQLGLSPITACHWPCVTSWTAISKSSLISVFFTNSGVPSQPMWNVRFGRRTNVIRTLSSRSSTASAGSQPLKSMVAS